jgi:hypothetical protein
MAEMMTARRFMNGALADPNGPIHESNGPMWVVELGPANMIVWATDEANAIEMAEEILFQLSDLGPSFHDALVDVEL